MEGIAQYLLMANGKYIKIFERAKRQRRVKKERVKGYKSPGKTEHTTRKPTVLLRLAGEP